MSLLLELFSAVKRSIIPAIFLLIGMIFCIGFYGDIEPHLATVNFVFYLLTFITTTLLILTKNSKNIFFVLILFLMYVYFNRIRSSLGITLVSQDAYKTLMMLLPINLIYLFFRKDTVFSAKENFYMLCALLSEGVIVENLYLSNIKFLPPFTDIIIYVLFLLVIGVALFDISRKPQIKTTGLFFVLLCVFISCAKVQDTISFVVSMTTAMFILLYSTLYNLIYEYYKDPATGVYSKNAFEIDALKKFPLKYSISFFVIDNYDKLLKVFKQEATDNLTKMIIERIKQVEDEALIYRYKPNEFILIFFSLDVNETYEKMDNIRRLIAMTEFVFASQKPLKLTITPVVSSKRRSDADAKAVLLRMNEFFRPKYRFTQNMTFCEEIEQSRKAKKSR